MDRAVVRLQEACATGLLGGGGADGAGAGHVVLHQQ
jgi:hypothetical protein